MNTNKVYKRILNTRHEKQEQRNDSRSEHHIFVRRTTVNEVTLRLATFDDVPRITLLAEQLGYPTTEEEMACRIAELFQQSNNAIWVAALPEGEVVGWIHLYVHRSLVANPVVMLGGIVVDEAYRGKGIGQRLMQHAEIWGQAHGCDAVYVKSNINRERAHNLYERLEYQKTKTQYAFRKDL